MWDRKTELVKEINAEPREERGIDVGNKCFQVSTITPKVKEAEVRKCGMDYVWRV
jgi:hypothetical protein